MGFHDRRYDSGSSDGGFRGALRRIFVNGEGFFSWSFPLFTVPRWIKALAGIHVRVHLLYILIAGSELLSSLQGDAIGFGFAFAMMGTLFLLVLLHEFGHCVACRWVGGDADQILMWPLGGLAFCRPPHRWQAALITTVGGPGVNVVLVPVLCAALLAAGAQWSDLAFNPLNPQKVLGNVFFAQEHWRKWLWAAHYMNFVLLAFNVLVPMYPMDSGRIVQEILWWRLGYKRSMEIAVNVGLVAAIVLGLIGMSYSNTRLIALAIFGGITCYGERQRVRMLADEPEWAYDTDRGYQALRDQDPPAPGRKGYKAALKQQEEQRRMQAEVDRILSKISMEGMQALTKREKDFLRDATEKGRKGT